MKTNKYILTKHETIRRIEKVEYVIEVPKNIKNKEPYVLRQMEKGNYTDYSVTDILDSEMLDEEIVDVRKKV